MVRYSAIRKQTIRVPSQLLRTRVWSSSFGSEFCTVLSNQINKVKVYLQFSKFLRILKRLSSSFSSLQRWTKVAVRQDVIAMYRATVPDN